jgi:hypothetical protein
MTKEVLFGIIRHVLTGAGSVLVAKGYTDQAGIEQAVGALLTIGGLVWSATHKNKVANQIEDASAK